MSANVKLTNERDIEILQDLWRWKVASTAALAVKFFPRSPSNACYNRLTALKLAGFVDLVSDERHQRSAWTLARKGFDAIRSLLPDLREEGFKSEALSHDLIVAAVHQGDWLQGLPQNVDVFTEQELRRIDPEFHESWVPKSDVHRPDGYWLIERGAERSLIALEVELSIKKTSGYQTLGDFYSGHTNIARVLWIVPSALTSKRILRKMNSGYSPRPDVHNFVSLGDFKAHLWGAPIHLGPEAGFSIRDFLNGQCPGKGLANPMQSPGARLGFALLTTQKKPNISHLFGLAPETQKTQMTPSLSESPRVPSPSIRR